ncbi:Rossmann-like and DUF2520 domain-containing protein [Legionella quateirensis]|uniref:Rossmann-like domain protein n=1 Tax=Legionella quateirensis TaxID=45072 RepID=A0A378KY91_9GAMM|nr:Rossmann-like and DUF2520 domain-containing protein [Legionella quateirensis]KTD44884.1 Rossmann-like domain protein [Legionella quateirensis]STY19493.1 Uncharacterized conserved protein [Legionella quateirensis]
MNYNIIGAGRLGKNLALALSTTQMLTLDSVCNRSFNSAQQACSEIKLGTAVNSLKQLPKTDVTWITCNDDSIESIVYQLIKDSVLKPDSFIIHCSGALNSELLSPLRELGCSVASFHPLKAFKSGYLNSLAFNQIDCVMEGDPAVCEWLHGIFSILGAHVIPIRSDAKIMYHTAATIASNYLITLAHTSEELLLQAGIPQHQARAMICNLMQGNINNLSKTSHIAESLTGPLCRGDIQTMSMHLKAIDNPSIKELYKKAGLATLPLAQLPLENKEIIKKMLED